MSAALLDDSLDQNVELWKIKKLIKSLEACRGYVTFKRFNKFPYTPCIVYVLVRIQMPIQYQNIREVRKPFLLVGRPNIAS